MHTQVITSVLSHTELTPQLIGDWDIPLYCSHIHPVELFSHSGCNMSSKVIINPLDVLSNDWKCFTIHLKGFYSSWHRLEKPGHRSLWSCHASWWAAWVGVLNHVLMQQAVWHLHGEKCQEFSPPGVITEEAIYMIAETFINHLITSPVPVVQAGFQAVFKVNNLQLL